MVTETVLELGHLLSLLADCVRARSPAVLVDRETVRLARSLAVPVDRETVLDYIGGHLLCLLTETM